MKTYYLLGGITGDPSMGLHLLHRDCFRAVHFHPTCFAQQLSLYTTARRWKTRAGIDRFIAAEKAAGSNWTYVVLPVVPLRATPQPAATPA